MLPSDMPTVCESKIISDSVKPLTKESFFSQNSTVLPEDGSIFKLLSLPVEVLSTEPTYGPPENFIYSTSLDKEYFPDVADTAPQLVGENATWPVSFGYSC